MSDKERFFRAAIVICLFAALVWFVVDGKALLSAIFGATFGTALERLIARAGQRC